ncbi:hypothetical protein B0T16DRAFT_336491 [Cercophora newfieldiana]|uniref:DUF7082 domain-containing protein n=1 Tax=Cercophora newfieldiana TaxID=92897 RepID=A0AA40CM74_9PEZI|nr:hypothetical protein B0T16DRAFT_336491 [Cercophora newfieldiana]
MSAAKFAHPVYKVYEPGYHPHRTIILDEQIESPETLTIRLEEEQSGGDLSGDSPTGLLPMSAYKAQPPQMHGYADSSYSQYSPQSYSTQPSESAASQINQLAFAANNAAAGQYLAASSPSLNVLSCYPSSGTLGTKVSMKVTTQGDLLSGSMSSSVPFVSVLFGSQRCASDVVKNSQDGSGSCTYTITTEAPAFVNTTCPSLSNIPLTLLVESANGTEIARASNAGDFSYHDGHSNTGGNGAGVGGSGDTSPPDLGSPKTRSPVQRGSPPHQNLPVPGNTASPPGTRGQAGIPVTNTYGFPPSLSVATAAAAVSSAQPQTSAQSDYVTDTAAAYNQGTTTNMLSTFRSSSFADPYSRAPPVLRSPHGAGWTPFGNHIESVRSPVTTIPHSSHTTITRPSLTPIQHSTSSAPQLFRTSTLQQGGGGSGNASYNPYSIYQTKATLKIQGDLGSMAENWTQEEWDSKRRLVLFRKQQNGSILTTSFKPTTASDRPPSSICISCIWWQEKEECFVTSVDTIHLLEQLVAAPNRFSVEEKNRIRRNLEGFHPLTVSKSKAESEEFFKVIMGFGNPKPRNIEKDVKVFPWKILGQALSKIISKYSASSAAIATHNLSGSYPSLPPNPGAGPSATTGDVGANTNYMGSGHHHHSDSISSPGARPLSGGAASWAAYSGAGTRTMSPSLKTSSPISTSGLRITTLPAVYDSRGSTHSLTSPYSVSSAHHSSHHSQGSFGQPAIPVSQGHARSWEAYSVAESYPTHGSHSHVYGGGAYGEGTQRA